MKWKLIEGYTRQLQYINEDGRIVGTVSGSDWGDGSEGWHATVEYELPRRPIGRYETEVQAKCAVELAILRTQSAQVQR